MPQHGVQAFKFIQNSPRVLCFLLVFLSASASCLVRAHWQHYELKQSDTKALHPMFSRKGFGEIECCLQCLHHGECRTVSYHAGSQTCELSSFPWKMARPSKGWKLMARNYECPFNAVDFKQEGSRHLSACEILLPYTAAKAACGQFGDLVKVESEADAETLHKFLSSKILGTEHFWVDGKLNGTSGSWLLSDGSELLENSTVWATGEPSKQGDCVMVSKSKKNSLASSKCRNKIAYICEKL